MREASDQHPAARVPSVGPAHDHGVVHLLDDRDEVITLQLKERGRRRVLSGGHEEEEEERRKEGERA